MRVKYWLLTLSCLCLAIPSYSEEAYEEDEAYYKIPTPLDSVVGFGGLYSSQQSSIEKGSRSIIKLSFNRLSKNIAIDLRYGTGLDYSDYGGMLKLFHHWQFTNSTSNSSGITLGAGGGGMYSEGIEDLFIDNEPKPFWDFSGGPFAQIVWDWGFGMGMAIEAEYLFVFKRQFLDEDTRKEAEKNKDILTDDFRNRFQAGISLMFEV